MNYGSIMIILLNKITYCLQKEKNIYNDKIFIFINLSYRVRNNWDKSAFLSNRIILVVE